MRRIAALAVPVLSLALAAPAGAHVVDGTYRSDVTAENCGQYDACGSESGGGLGGSTSSSSSGGGGTCSGGPIPESQMLNESGGDPNVTNSTGHFGCWQLAPEHYSGGICSDLGKDVDGQRTCANRVYDAQGPGAWTAPIG